MKVRKLLCKAFAKNLASGLLENLEVSCNQDLYALSDNEVVYIQKELQGLADKLASQVDYDLLSTLKSAEPIEDKVLWHPVK